MIKKVLFVQSFVLEKDALSNEILVWEIYLENFLKSKMPYLEFDLLYLPIEQDLGHLSITSYKEIELFEEDMFNMISELNFGLDCHTLIGISVTTSHHYISSLIIGEFFQKYYPESFIVFGGAHVSACPNDFINKNSIGDFIITGEGEIPLYNLIKRSLKKQERPLMLKGETIYNLNDLPPIDFSILDKYIKKFNHLSISLSRGCPFGCVFCMENTLLNNNNTKKWRSYSPKRAIQEVDTMITYGSQYEMKAYGFYDPTFGLDQKWLDTFLDLYTYEDQTYAWIETRLDVLNENLLYKITQNNFFLMYGLESYSKNMLKIMNKTNNPNLYLKKFERLLEIHRKIDSFFIINILVNHPGETRQTQSETFKKLEEMILKYNIDPQSFNIRFYHHFPGTRIYITFDEYHKKYRSFSFFPEWYKTEDLLKYGAYTVRPSIEFSLRESFSRYTENYQNLFTMSINNMDENKKRRNMLMIASIKKQISYLNSKKELFFEFLDKNQIEIY